MAVLTVDAVAQMDAARADVNSMGDAVRNLGADASSAGDQARAASANFDGLAEGSDNVASKSSQAAGAMGDLAGGLEAIGATGAATALEGVALGSQVAAGAGDALNLVAETSVGRWVASTAASVAHRTATIAGSIATGAMTAAQTALNVVLAANPVLLIVAGIALLVGGLILAYKHSETFRDIVDGAFSRAKAVIEGAVEAVQDIIGWFRDLPAEARDAWDSVSKAVGEKIGEAVEFVDGLIEDVKRLPREAASTVAGYFSDMFAPIQTAVGWVQDLIDKIKSIDFPDFPDLNPFGRGLRPGETPGTEGGRADPVDPLAGAFVINLTAAKQDQDESMRNLIDGLREYLARQGQTLSITEAPA